jgi:hypothetical protein
MPTSDIQVYSGGIVNPIKPAPNTIFIEDIAHALSLQCRFQGHTRRFYSVAQHSVAVAHRCPPELRLTGLLHDASEAYIQDMASPLKQDPVFGEHYRVVERRLMMVISGLFGAVYPLPQAVKEVDLRMLATEVPDLMGGRPDDELWVPWIGNVEPFPHLPPPQTPARAEREFLTLFKQLTEC